ncbi:toll/interleukin-1 receptor domain-containing protein [Sphingomonas sp. BK069]|uniref:toll/interleukin-1 receptor domain-containing protein n=1 Tax=Sphingomonas sp. BK069 TaxID=2586979 RepID=UPI001616F92B|nr:toll/interleukin-1 receptor domain-containing protein [Sphingomonas sp. BK069]MBB3349437.1 hypothetical protein [Sphingomonas sp. BK069]
MRQAEPCAKSHRENTGTNLIALKRIFVSYSHEDKLFVDELLSALSNRVGNEVEFVRDVHVLRAGSPIATELTSQIEASDGMLAVLPKNDEGAWFFAELAIALNKASKDPGYRIIPVLAHSTTKVPFVLRSRLYLNLAEEKDFESGALQLARVLLSQTEPSYDIDPALAEKASIDARRAFLHLAKAQHELEKAYSRKSYAFALTASLAASVTTAAPLVYLSGLSERQLWSIFSAVTILALGVFLGRLSTVWSPGKSPIPPTKDLNK